MAESKPSDTTKYLVDIDFSEENGGPIRLRTEEEFQDWQQKEVGFWKWLIKHHQRRDTSSIRSFIYLWDNIGPSLQNYRNGLRLRKNGAENEIPFFHSGSRKAQTVDQIKELYGEDAGLGALIFALGADFSTQSNFLPASFFIGAIQYSLIYEGISPQTPQMAVNALDGMRSRAQQKFDELEQKSQALISSLEEKGEGFDRARDVLKRYIPSRWNAFKSESKKDTDAAIKRIHDTDELFKRQMEIKAPVDYWRTKKKNHTQAKERYLKYLIRYALVALPATAALILFFPIITGLLDFILDYLEKPTPDWHYIAIPLLLVWTTTIFWAGRVLVRLFLSEHHLAGDAEERAVMAQTYLALVNEDKADKEDRHIVLETLFRHSTDGIVKDDAAPNLSLPQFLSK